MEDRGEQLHIITATPVFVSRISTTGRQLPMERGRDSDAVNLKEFTLQALEQKPNVWSWRGFY